eukprot:scaffold5226_cov100-Isochrysis_galbana.AAC.2
MARAMPQPAARDRSPSHARAPAMPLGVAARSPSHKVCPLSRAGASRRSRRSGCALTCACRWRPS